MAFQQETPEGLRELALFAGAGGGILGGKLLGWRTVCAVEINDYCRRVLMQRQDDGILEPFPIWDDVRTFDGKPWRGIVDVVSSGFPCQRNSTIGNIHGSNYFDGWPDTVRIIGAIRPRFALLENVPGVVFDLGRITGDLAEIGYDLRWDCFSCFDASNEAPQIGERWFGVAKASCNRLETEEPGLAECSQARQSSMPSATNCATWFSRIPEPSIPCLADGLAGYMGEVSAIGNGQVPAVVRLAWETLSGIAD